MYLAGFSDEIRHEASIATMLGGSIQNADQATILAGGRADLVALARPHLDAPYLGLHAAAACGHEQCWPWQ